MKRGAVYLATQEIAPVRDRDGRSHGGDLPEYAALRPVIVVSRDAINRHAAVVLVCPLVDAASVHQPYPSDVVVRSPEGGLTADSVVMTGQLRALARAQLVRQLGELSAEVMHEVDRALRITLDLE